MFLTFPIPFEGIYIFFFALAGLCLGSFLNVVIYRLPQMIQESFKAECEHYLHPEHPSSPALPSCSLIKPGSFCPSCRTPLSIWHNIPLLSFLWLKGKCASCQSRISWQYPLIESLSALFTIFSGFYYGINLEALGALIFCLTLLSLACIDLKHQLLPDILTLPLLWTGLLFNMYEIFSPLQDAIWGAIGGYIVLWLFARIFYHLTGKDGLAYGDMKLFAALGAWLGWQALLPILLWASLAGSIVGILWLCLTKQSRATPIPFGPFLSAAGLVQLFFK